MPHPVVVVIEDEPHIRRFVRSALEAEGWQVHEADTAQKGLTEAGTRKPDLLVLDLGLPDGDGMEVIRDVRGWSGVPIIVLSARSDEADKIAALDAGADDYLTKPFGVGELLARVRANLRRPRADPPPAVKRSLGAIPCSAKPLPAHLHGPPAAKAGAGPDPASAFAHGDRSGLPAGEHLKSTRLSDPPSFQALLSAKCVSCLRKNCLGSYQLNSKCKTLQNLLLSVFRSRSILTAHR